MATRKLKIKKILKTIEDLENECNFKEANLPGRLQRLEAIGEAKDHVTEGTFDKLPDVEEGLGNLKFKLDNGGTNTAWINGIKIKVSFK